MSKIASNMPLMIAGIFLLIAIVLIAIAVTCLLFIYTFKMLLPLSPTERYSISIIGYNIAKHYLINE